MAEVAKSSTAPVAETAKSKAHVEKPEKPDEDEYRKGLAKLEKEHKTKQDAYNAIKAKLEVGKPKEGSPTAERQKELRAQLATIRKSQAGSKESRQGTMDKIKRLDEQLKARITEQKNARGKLAYKSAEEVDRAIAQLQKQVDSGTMKIVDEKKALSEISQLNRQKKSFGGIDDAEKGIADVKAQIAELKKTMDDPEARAMSEKYNTIQKELDEIKAEQDVVYKNINQLRDQRTKLQNEQQEAWQALKAHKDDFFARKRAAREYENKAYQIRKEKQAAEQQAYLAGKRKANAEQRLEEASAPAFQDEILTAQGLIRYFDPSAVDAKEVAAPSKFAATSGRTVNDEAFKGMKAVKKDEQEDFFIGGGGKKKKGGKKGAAAGTSTPAETTSKFNLNLGVLEDLAKVKVDAPSSQADVPKLVEALKEKVSKWKADQDKQTKENIAKAQKEIDRLEAEEAAHEGEHGSLDIAKKPAAKNAGLNGKVSAEAELAQEKDGVADATADLAAAKIEDNE
ncbi:hypothetical protein BLS_009718 [Venturia inaequalis]|uniref:Nuclear segregation protein n=1 Tax=Venturia inaequalis TaxID=5025 RepID=A0A8H3YJV0_VENIN|nr:hypothetical protein BLS_009718 [Venturia inaequalis]